jgi:signal peptidase I
VSTINPLPPANLVATWVGAACKPRAFFSRPALQRSRIGPVTFALIVSLASTIPSSLFTPMADASVVNRLGFIVGSLLMTLLGVYVTAGVLHVLLRIFGTGYVHRAIPRDEHPSGAPLPNATNNQYEPPRNEDALEKARPGSFNETLHAVCYSRAPLVAEVFGPIGAVIGTLWSLVILGIAFAQVHRMSILRGYVVSLSTLVGPVVFALGLRVGVIEAFKIPAGSMMPTLMIGDHIFVSKFAYGPLVPGTDTRLFSRLPPSRGDVIVFKFPENKTQDFIKRVISLPGDTFDVINGRPIINGWLVPHCYVGNFDGRLYVEFLGDASYLTLFAHDDLYPNGPDEPICTTQDDCTSGQVCRGGICGHHQGPFKVRANETWVLGDNRYNSHDSRSWRGGMGAGVPYENIKGRASYVWMSFAKGGSVSSERTFYDVMGPPELPGTKNAVLQSAIDKCMRERPKQTTPPEPGPSKVIDP